MHTNHGTSGKSIPLTHICMSTHISGMPIKNSGGLNLLDGLKRKKKKKNQNELCFAC